MGLGYLKTSVGLLVGRIRALSVPGFMLALVKWLGLQISGLGLQAMVLWLYWG